MALAASTPVGHYKILRALGQGGMGEVYAAIDERLGREVALKMMHPALSRGAERLKRFETEARAASAINHPNILSVFDVGTLDGAPYIVTELLDGDVLRDLLSGPLGVRKSLDLARQIALGLAAAHDRGIVHRDIKPENLFVTRDGHLKILDFGVAKLLDLGDDNITDDRPTTPALTTPEAVLGTPGYMAPEQVRGDPIDPRADVFALGAVLYEMLTGKRAFAGKAPHAVMYAVLHGDPPAMADAGLTVSPVVEAVVRRCLEKRRDERFASARDLAFQLDALATGASTTMTPSMIGHAPAPAPKSRRGLVAAAAIGGLAAAAAVAWVAWPSPAPVAPVAKLAPIAAGTVPELAPVTFRSGRITSARLARDDKQLYLGAAWTGEPQRIHTATIGRPEVTSLGIEGDVMAITADGDLLVLLGSWFGLENPRTLVRIPPSGGARTVIADQVLGADGGPDGEIALIRRAGARYRVEYPLGTLIDETDGWFANIRVSPDGKRLAYLVHPMREDDRGWPVIATLADGSKEPLSGEWAGTQGVTWDPQGRGIYFSAGFTGIRVVWYGGDGDEVRQIAAVTSNLDVYDVLPDGSLLGVVWQWDVHARMQVPGGEPADVSWYDTTNPVDLSADGKTLLFVESGLAAQQEVYRGYLRNPDGSVLGLGGGQPTDLSPDGKRVLVLHPGKLRATIVSTGADPVRDVNSGTLSVQAVWWFPDGERVLVSGAEPGSEERLWVVRDDRAPEALTGPGESAARFERPISADGALLTYTDASGRRAVMTLADRRPQAAPQLGEDERFLAWYGDSHDWILAHDRADGVDLFRLGVDGARTSLGEVTVPVSGSTIATWWMQVTPDARGWAYAYFSVLSRAYVVRLQSTITVPPRSSP